MRFTLLLLVLGAVTLSADAIQCYTCTTCSEKFYTSQNSISSGCTYCAKYKYYGTTTVNRVCAQPLHRGKGLRWKLHLLLQQDRCNSGERLRSLSWLLLLPAAAMAVISCRL
uniref:Secreted protein n=1 Tax=Macrostomum lignano TaxID=282301 RepID=A0A1I8JIG8_9PLAT